MNRIALIAVGLCALALPLGASGQTDPHTYTDPAMSFTAPADFTPIPVPSSSPDQFQGPTVVAAFARHPKQSDMSIITLQMENTNEDLNDFEADAEAKARNQGSESVFVKKDLTTLPNGMPAYFLDITASQDAGESKIYEYIWVDHVRGVTLAISGRFGVIDDKSAKKALANVSAVAYPRNRY
jgi:hypothetical protein